MSFVYVALGLFCLGLYGVLTRRDIIAVLASVEVMLGAATVMLVGLSATSQIGLTVADPATTGATGLVIIVLAAAEASVGLGLLLAVVKRIKTANIDELQEVKG